MKQHACTSYSFGTATVAQQTIFSAYYVAIAVPYQISPTGLEIK